jgi:para-nitrobenzyl esterase
MQIGKIAGALLGLAVVFSAGLAHAQQVKIDTGTIEGATADGVTSFKGVPFAAPPLGQLRWRAPQPVKPWSGVRKATAYSGDCMQLPFPSDAAPLGTEPSEDCLYANVWLPADKPAGKLPIIIWIYGGGSVNGGASPAVYSGANFAKHGLMFVSFNYRLGRFGYFAHPALTAENADNGLLGNYGYMDQIAALKWVQRNAAAFGGDPQNVTVFGESHGGRSVQMLLGTSMANGLFQRAAIESGFGRQIQPQISGSEPNTLLSAEDTGLAFAKSIGVEGTGKEALAKLRAMPALTIRSDLNFTSSRLLYSGPMIDGKLVPQDTPGIYLGGGGQHVPLLLGTNSEDTGTVAGKTLDDLFATFGPYADQANKVYAGDGASEKVIRQRVGSDHVENEPIRMTARAFAARGLPVYEFRFSYVAESLRKEWTGAHHASEIPFVFNTVSSRYGKDLTDQDDKISKMMLQYWVNYAKTGDPNGEGLPVWPRYSTKDDVLMNFTDKGIPVAMPDPFKDRLDVTAAAASSVPAPQLER